MKRILCYGDSNTWGCIPGVYTRYPEEVRWPGVLQAALADSCRIIEAGLCGRTTAVDDPFDPELNGLKALPNVLRSAGPIDLVILMLGTNDLKFQDAWGAARGCQVLIDTIRRHPDCFVDGKPQILLVSPVHVREDFAIVFTGVDGSVLSAESHKFASLYGEFAAVMGLPFFDAAQVAKPSPADGIHMDAENHKALGLALQPVIENLLF